MKLFKGTIISNGDWCYQIVAKSKLGRKYIVHYYYDVMDEELY